MTVLDFKELSKNYGSIVALERISVAVEAGKITGLLGPNGSGKTTMIKLAAGLLTPTAGSCTVNGRTPGMLTKAEVAYLPDRIALPQWMNIHRLLEYYSDFYRDFDRERALKLIQDLGIPEKQTIKSMSKGTQEKVQLILVMCRNARLYLLDEPLSGVDPATRDYILNTIIRNYNPEAAVVISTHLISDVENILDDVIFIQNGKLLLSSSVDDIRENHGKSVDEYFREVFRV